MCVCAGAFVCVGIIGVASLLSSGALIPQALSKSNPGLS